MKRWLPVLATVIAAALLLSSCAQPSMPTPAPLPTEPTELPAEEARGKAIGVTSTADSGSGTLRQALLDAESGDTITFDPSVFPPNAPATIYLTSSLECSLYEFCRVAIFPTSCGKTPPGYR